MTSTSRRVCLILANAHGGSTISNLVVGQHPDVFSAGTLRGFPENGQFDPDNACSCGRSTAECDLWGPLRDRFEKNLIDGRKSAEKQLLGDILDASGAQVIVDVDHGMGQLRSLASHSGIDLRVLFVVRDKHAVAYSRLRKDRKMAESGAPTLSRNARISKTVRAWAHLEAGVERFCSARRIPLASVSYEQLCMNPRGALESVGTLLDLDYGPVVEAIEAGHPLVPPAHLLRGNRKLRARLEKGIVLRYDESFRSGLDFTDRALILAWYSLARAREIVRHTVG